jgi:hypothetical protein
MKPLFVGFGQQAFEYAKVFKFLDIEITSVLVRDIKKKNKILSKFKVKNIYNDLDLALKENKFNCIFIFLPWNKIEKKILYILKKTNKTIYSEKPIALSTKKLTEINQYVKRKNRKLFILYNRRYYSTYSYIKKKIKNSDFEITAHIPEKKSYVIKNIDKKLNGKIKFHLTSHWVDFFTSLFGLRIINFTKKLKNFYFKLDGKSKNNIISIKYDDEGFIKANFNIKKQKYKFKTLEKVYKKDNSSNRFNLLMNENKINKFKPGILNLAKALKNKEKIILPETKDLIKIYKYLEKLPY